MVPPNRSRVHPLQVAVVRLEGLQDVLLQDIDLRTQVTSLDVPVYLVQGGHETPARAGPAAQWFRLRQAPTKQLITFPDAGHRALFQQPERFYQVMAETVLPQTRSS
jgi:pimeloyl-ACP methyl ester carboxylesterase